MEEDKPKAISAFAYNGSNGIVICCSECGSEFEETCNGKYPPLQYEHERYNRLCLRCIRYYHE
jgi:hypothetical protein